MYSYSPFRNNYEPKVDSNTCNFCIPELMEEQGICNGAGEIIENEHYRWTINTYPKFDGHTMIIPKRHITNLKEETSEEVLARQELLITASDALLKVFPGAGIEIFLQTGTGSAGSVKHLHWHLVPADPADPLRSFEKLGHFYTTKQDEEKVVLFPIPIKLVDKDLQMAIAKIL